MSDSMSQLATSVEQIGRFTGKNLASKISELEFQFANRNRQQVAESLSANSVSQGLVEAARAIKRAAAQIDVVLHALGILVLLPSILEDDEIVEALSLGAGSSEAKRFDLETSRRVAEFTFIEWKGNDNVRLQKVFKDFYRLAEFRTTKKKELWLTDDVYILRYLRGGSSIRAATGKHREVWEGFQRGYPQIHTVGDYYRLRASEVQFRTYAPAA